MMRNCKISCRLFVSCLVLLTVAVAAGAQDEQDPVKGRLEAARSDFAKTMTKVRDEYSRFLSTSEERARRRGDKELVDRIKRAREEFSRSEVVGTDAPVSLQRRISAAVSKLEKAFDSAISDYTRSGNDEAANSLKTELRQMMAPRDAKEFQGRLYKAFKEQISWQDAYDRCTLMKGHLVVIRSHEENTFITDIAAFAGIERVWLGATDREQEGTWNWITSEPLTYSRWHRWSATDVEPNDYRGAEDYASLSVTERGEWHDTNGLPGGSDVLGFVCQWD